MKPQSHSDQERGAPAADPILATGKVVRWLSERDVAFAQLTEFHVLALAL